MSRLPRPCAQHPGRKTGRSRGGQRETWNEIKTYVRNDVFVSKKNDRRGWLVTRPWDFRALPQNLGGVRQNMRLPNASFDTALRSGTLHLGVAFEDGPGAAPVTEASS